MPWAMVRTGLLVKSKPFGRNGYYFVDFYHVCDYLSIAAKAIHSDDGEAATWMDVQKSRLKNRQAAETLSTLQSHLEAGVPEANAPVRCGHRYFSYRRQQLDHQSALPVTCRLDRAK